MQLRAQICVVGDGVNLVFIYSLYVHPYITLLCAKTEDLEG